MTTPDPAGVLTAFAGTAANLGAAASAGAAALKQLPVLQQQSADLGRQVTLLTGQKHDLETLVADLRKQLEQAGGGTPPPPPPSTAARFPGDPGPGRILLGVATAGGNLPRVDEHEKAVGRRLVRRRYLNNGMTDLAAPIRKWITEDHKAGRIPAPSIKPGPFGTIASGKWDTQIRDYVGWAEQQPLPIFQIIDHEPENNLKGQPAQAQHDGAAKFRADQQHMRALIDEVTGGKPKRLSFGGSLLGYNWSTGARSGPTPLLALPDEWFPGAGVWDWCGIDHYIQKSGGTVFDTKWNDAVVSVKKWGVPLAVTELGIRSSDPQSPSKLVAFYAKVVELGGVMILYYDSDTNSTAEGWILTGAQLEAWRKVMTDPRTVNAPV